MWMRYGALVLAFSGCSQNQEKILYFDSSVTNTPFEIAHMFLKNAEASALIQSGSDAVFLMIENEKGTRFTSHDDYRGAIIVIATLGDVKRIEHPNPSLKHVLMIIKPSVGQECVYSATRGSFAVTSRSAESCVVNINFNLNISDLEMNKACSDRFTFEYHGPTKCASYRSNKNLSQ